MYIAVKEQGKTYLGVTNADCMSDMSTEDMLLDENFPMWKIAGRKGWYMVCGRAYVEVDLLRYTKGLFDKEINYQTLLRHTIPCMKELLESRGLVKDRCWYNDLLIISNDKVYNIDGYFCLSEVDDFVVSSAREDIIRGCMEFNKDLPAKVRICEGAHSLEIARGKGHYPLVVVDLSTGKKETWMSHEQACEKMYSVTKKRKK